MVDTVTACLCKDCYEIANLALFSTDKGTRVVKDKWNDSQNRVISKDKLYQNLSHFRVEVNNIDGQLYFRASLPHLVDKSSLYEIQETDIGRSIEAVHSILSKSGIKTTETAVSESKVHRIDLCKNLHVDHNCKDYIAVLDNFRMPKSDKINFELETLMFGSHSKNRQVCIYNKVRQLSQVKDIKEREVVSGMPENILRFESRLLNNRTIKKELKNSLSFYSIFNKQLAREQLLRDFNRIKDVEKTQLSLNFDNEVELFSQLRESFGNRAFEAYLGVKGGADNILREMCFQYKAVLELFTGAGLGTASAYRNADKLFEYYRLKPLAENRGLIAEIKEKLAA